MILWRQVGKRFLSLVTGADTSIGNCVALDCEMVGAGPKGSIAMVGRCAVVNHHGHVLLDAMVAPYAPVTDYRTKYSGLRKTDFVDAISFKSVQEEVRNLICGRILVGQDVAISDLKILGVTHPSQDIRDTCKFSYCPFEKMKAHKYSSLKNMTLKQLGIAIQEGEHSPVEDARASMALYQMNKTEWEAILNTS